jgi:hypothetical protein
MVVGITRFVRCPDPAESSGCTFHAGLTAPARGSLTYPGFPHLTGKIQALGKIAWAIDPWIFPKAGNFPVVLSDVYTKRHFRTTALTVSRPGAPGRARVKVRRLRGRVRAPLPRRGPWTG